MLTDDEMMSSEVTPSATAELTDLGKCLMKHEVSGEGGDVLAPGCASEPPSVYLCDAHQKVFDEKTKSKADLGQGFHYRHTVPTLLPGLLMPEFCLYPTHSFSWELVFLFWFFLCVYVHFCLTAW